MSALNPFGQRYPDVTHYDSDEDEEENFNELSGNTRDGLMREDEETGKPSNVKLQKLELTADGALEERLLIRRDGWMMKKGGTINQRGGVTGGGRKNWKKRWFVLTEVGFRGQTGYELRYYDRPGGSLKGSVGLSEVTIFTNSTQKRDYTNMIKKYEFQIQLPHGGSLNLSCDEPEEREEWLDTLHVVTDYLRLLTHPELAMVINGYNPMNEEDPEIYRQGEEIAQQCQAYGPGIGFGAEAGQQQHFMLDVHDIEGEPVSRGGMPVTCTIGNDELLYYVAMTDNENGSYGGYYTLCTPGVYQLSIRLNDEHEVFGSPFEITILPGKTVAAYSIAEGNCLTEIVPGEPTSFLIYACDRYGNKKPKGGDQFEVGITGPGRVITFHDEQDGSYLCTIEADDPTTLNYYAPSSLMIVVTLHGKAISGSPFRPIILDAPKKTTVSHGSESPSISEAAAEMAARTQLQQGDVGVESMSAEEKDESLSQSPSAGLRQDTGVENTFVDDSPSVAVKSPESASIREKSASSRLERARARANRAKAMLS